MIPSATRLFSGIGLAWIALAVTGLAQSPEVEPPAGQSREDDQQYLRVQRSDQNVPTSLQTAIVSYASRDAEPGDLRVDLIGAVHVGDRGYYEKLNKAFQEYDVVLYELVAPEGTRVKKGAGASNKHPVAAMQNGFKNLLELDHQLEIIDYNQENFVHADMSPEQLAKSMSDRGESVWGMFFRMIGAGIARQAKQQSSGQSSDADILAAMLDKDRAGSLKRVMAVQFEDMDVFIAAFGGPDGSTIITERNKVALKELGRQIDLGRKKIAIFYGAGHLPDMHERLIKDFSLHKTGKRWLTAWDLRGAKAAPDPAPKAKTRR